MPAASAETTRRDTFTGVRRGSPPPIHLLTTLVD